MNCGFVIIVIYFLAKITGRMKHLTLNVFLQFSVLKIFHFETVFFSNLSGIILLMCFLNLSSCLTYFCFLQYIGSSLDVGRAL